MHSSILAWKIKWKEEPGRLWSTRGYKELDTAEQLSPCPCACYSQSFNLSLLPSSYSYKFALYICNYFSLVDRFICILFLLIPHVRDSCDIYLSPSGLFLSVIISTSIHIAANDIILLFF